jgi:NAD-reducing hydrogenase small subunit
MSVTIATDWLAGCAGCHMSLLDLDERLLAVAGKATILSTPVTDLKHPPIEGVTVGILEGAVNNTANESVARCMRSRCKVLIALGDCAVFGGVPSLCNAANQQDALRRAYIETESTVDGLIPDDPALAHILPCRAVDQVVDVDIYLPGCPPSADAIFHVIGELLEGRTPALTGRLLHWH